MSDCIGHLLLHNTWSQVARVISHWVIISIVIVHKHTTYTYAYACIVNSLRSLQVVYDFFILYFSFLIKALAICLKGSYIEKERDGRKT